MKPKNPASVVEAARARLNGQKPRETVVFQKGTVQALTDLLNSLREAQMLTHGVYHERHLRGGYRIVLLGAQFEPVPEPPAPQSNPT